MLYYHGSPVKFNKFDFRKCDAKIHHPTMSLTPVRDVAMWHAFKNGNTVGWIWHIRFKDDKNTDLKDQGNLKGFQAVHIANDSGIIYVKREMVKIGETPSLSDQKY